MKKMWIVLLLVTMLVTTTACGQGAADEVALTKLEEIQEAGVIVVGTSAGYPPYEWHMEVDGKDTIVGFDIDIAKKIADDLGVELEIMDMKFEGLLPALIGGKIDFIAAGMTPTDERKQSVDFSVIYYDSGQTMLVAADDVDTLTTTEDFVGLRVGVQKASIQEQIAAEHFGESTIKAIAKIPDLILELQSGKIDGIILADTVATSYAKANDDIAVNGIDLGSEGGVALAFQKEQPELVDAVNASLEALMSSGEIDEIITENILLANKDQE